MIAVLVAFALGALVLPVLARSLGRSVFLVAALVPTAAFALTLGATPVVLAGGEVTEYVSWIPQLSLALSFRVDTLAWLLSLVVAGVGALVMLYCARYFRADEPNLGRFAATLLAFAGAMYGLVIADDVFLLFVFWEATSVFSYLLIGHYSEKKASRGAALQALLVTTLGGLVMLVGLVLLAVETGTSSVAGIVDAAPTGPLAITAIMLVLIGALSKSAIVPFHFWLPAAMAAPTPVSAYLHAAAMVKAGIYLIARMAPGFADLPGWREVLVGLGVLTMLVGAWTALRQTDLKLVLAHGTVSQLGFLTVIAGYGTRDSGLAAVALLLAHALYKSTLFLVVGIIDHRAGTRDLRKLCGLGREAPVLAVTATLALASMAGIPPTFGFVAKEAVFTSLVEDAGAGSALGWVALVGVAVGSALTVAYSLRFLWGAFGRKKGVPAVEPFDESPTFLFSPVLLALSGVAVGILAVQVDPTLVGYADLLPGDGEPYYLALWHGFTPALFTSLGTLLTGIGLFVARDRVGDLQRRLSTRLSAPGAYAASMKAVDVAAARTTSLTQRGSLPFYVGVIITVFTVAISAALVVNRTWPSEWRPFDYPAQGAIAVVMIVAAIASTRAAKRFQAVVLVGVTGFGMSALFAMQGAPELALTQILVEAFTLIAFVLVLRRLPARLGEKNGSAHRVMRAVIGILFGLGMAVVAVVALGARSAERISLEWPRLAYEDAHGRNVVNVALVDLRGWDTMGELSVVIAAATGVASLIFLNSRTDDLPRIPRKQARQAIRSRRRTAADPASGDGARSSWLLAGRTLAPRNRSILLEVVVRLVFHPLIVVSVYLLFAGHNTPGGGFAGGLVAGLALASRYLAGGRGELGAAAPFGAGTVLGAGLVIATGTALLPLFFGSDALTSSFFQAEVWPFGQLEFVTSTFFDIGVYLVVIGLALDVLRSLGAEVDRQQEDEPGGSDGDAAAPSSTETSTDGPGSGADEPAELGTPSPTPTGASS